MAPVQKPVNEDEILGLPKWVWAAIAGGVITTGIAIYIFAGNDGGKKKKPKKKATTTTTAASVAKSSASSTPKATPQKASSKVTVQDAPNEDDIEEVRWNPDLSLCRLCTS